MNEDLDEEPLGMYEVGSCGLVMDLWMKWFIYESVDILNPCHLQFLHLNSLLTVLTALNFSLSFMQSSMSLFVYELHLFDMSVSTYNPCPLSRWTLGCQDS